MAQIINAIYEEGVLKPLEPLDIKEHTKVRIIIEPEKELKKKAEEILELARKSYEGLSEEQISLIESARLDANSFFPKRVDSK